jgi:rhodanese-related sulfurtransferase
MNEDMGRRGFLGLATCATLVGALGMAGCAREAQGEQVPGAASLPPSSPDPESEFGVDAAINMSTIDDYLDRPDVMYRDLRMLRDTAAFDEVGGDPELSFTLPGFRIIPFPYIATLPKLPVEGRYDGDVLFVTEWNEDMSIRTAIPKYQESEQILEEVFPKDTDIFLMCGGGGYAAFMKKLLVFLGWDEGRLYNIGGAWDYQGPNFIDLVQYDANNRAYYYHWRAMYTIIDFSQFSLLAGAESGAASKNPPGLKKQSKHCLW